MQSRAWGCSALLRIAGASPLIGSIDSVRRLAA
jgi:hypothetical protein